MLCLRPATRAGQFVLGQFVDDFNARYIGGQRFAFAAALGRSNDFFVFCNAFFQHGNAFGFVEQRQLRCVSFDRLLGLAAK